jgi:hypothetical protein
MIALPNSNANNELKYEWQHKVLRLLQQVIVQLPPRELSRRIRDFFLLFMSDMKTVPPDFEDRLLQLMAVLQLLDDAEDDMKKSN